MRTVSNWGRMVLALVIALAVAGPALVLAVPPDPSYTISSSILLGPSTVAAGSTGTPYTLQINYTNGQSSLFPPETGATFTATGGGSFGGDNTYDAPGAPGKVKLTATFTLGTKKVTANRIVTVTP